MKVNETNTAAPGQPSGAPPVSDVAASVVPAPDRATTEETSRLKDSVSAGINMAATERELRLQSLTQEVRSGTYRPSVSQLADEILAQADLDARLARDLH